LARGPSLNFLALFRFGRNLCSRIALKYLPQ
jgi:hypothetical protein